MKIGHYTLHTIETGRFALDGGSMFGVVPKTLWCKGNPSDERNRIDMALRGLLIMGQGRVILVDTGSGTKLSPKLVDIYKIDNASLSLNKSLSSVGLSAKDITDVILTHLHFDHCGGSTFYEGKELAPAFLNAKYYIQKNQWEWANNPTEKDRASFVDENFVPLKKWGMLELPDGEFQFLSGIDILVTRGHSPGHQLVKVSDGKKTVLYAGDTIPMSPHLQLPWNMAYDNEPLITIEEKRAILNKAVAENWVVLFEHDPYIIGATVSYEEGRFKMSRSIHSLEEIGEPPIAV